MTGTEKVIAIFLMGLVVVVALSLEKRLGRAIGV
jgi:hypothetical protein